MFFIALFFLILFSNKLVSAQSPTDIISPSPTAIINTPTPTIPVPTFSISINSNPSSATLGQSFQITFSVQGAKPNTNYSIKVYGGIGETNTYIQTGNNDSWFNYSGANSGWASMPSFNSDTGGSITNTITARANPEKTSGLYNLKIKTCEVDNDFSNCVVSIENKTIQITDLLPTPTVPTPTVPTPTTPPPTNTSTPNTPTPTKTPTPASTNTPTKTPTPAPTTTLTKTPTPTLSAKALATAGPTPTETFDPEPTEEPVLAEEVALFSPTPEPQSLGISDVVIAPSATTSSKNFQLPENFLPLLLISSGGLLLLTPLVAPLIISKFKN